MTSAARDLQGGDVRRLYGRWSSVYDGLCGPVFRPAHRAAAEAANLAGRRILEVGVGTGLVLPLYRQDAVVDGIDLSDAMLARARDRVARQGLAHVRSLQRLDICACGPGSPRLGGQPFDAVVFPFVLTLVERPERALDHALSMLRPGGEIVVASHLRSEHRLAARVETALAPLLARVGLRPDFPLSRIAAWADAAKARLIEARPVGPLGVYTLARIGKV